jgi:hypothetical protein
MFLARQAMEQWKHLRQNDAQLPSLLVKASFSKNGYSIRLTDLSRIWAEELDKAEIISRARARNCSIDPGEDAEQYDIFNEKLQSAAAWQHHSCPLHNEEWQPELVSRGSIAIAATNIRMGSRS